MCAGAMLHARLEQVYFGAPDPKTGALGGAFDLYADYPHNHRIAVQSGLLEVECASVLRAFFQARRP